jgi:hypothetical protein
MQGELPGWVEEMDGRGVRLGGRKLDLPADRAGHCAARSDARTNWSPPHHQRPYRGTVTGGGPDTKPRWKRAGRRPELALLLTRTVQSDIGTPVPKSIAQPIVE